MHYYGGPVAGDAPFERQAEVFERLVERLVRIFRWGSLDDCDRQVGLCETSLGHDIAQDPLVRDDTFLHLEV